jgi:hypothetical protein
MRSSVRWLGVVVLGPGSVTPLEWKDTPECLTASETGLDPGTERLCDGGREDGFSVRSVIVLRMRPSRRVLVKGM